MPNLIAGGSLLALATVLAAPEKALTWPECRERYLAIANEGQPSAEEAENGWPLIASLATEAREAEKRGLPLDEAWFERAAGIAEYERFVRDVSEEPSLSTSTDDLTGAGREARGVARPLHTRLLEAIERQVALEAATLFEQLLALSRATALQPSIIALLASHSIHPADPELATLVADGRVPGELSAALLRALNEADPLPPASRNFRGDGWLGAEPHFVPSPLHKMTPADVMLISNLIRGVVAVNELAGRAADLPRGERADAGVGPDEIRAEAERRLNGFDLDEGWASMAARALANVDSSTSIRNGVHTLLGIEAYRHRRGQLPDTLDDLVPDCLAALPVDSFAPDGRFVYRLVNPADDPHGRSYLLYSVGSDGVDNGGVAAAWIQKAYFEQEAGTDAVFNRPHAD